MIHHLHPAVQKGTGIFDLISAFRGLDYFLQQFFKLLRHMVIRNISFQGRRRGHTAGNAAAAAFGWEGAGSGLADGITACL